MCQQFPVTNKNIHDVADWTLRGRYGNTKLSPSMQRHFPPFQHSTEDGVRVRCNESYCTHTQNTKFF